MYDGRLLMIETPDGLRKKAYGGDVVGIKTTEGMSFAQRHELEALPFVHGKIKVIDEKENDVIVDEASTAIPALIEWCQAQNLNVEMIEKSSPPFDDVFVKIIEMETAHA